MESLFGYYLEGTPKPKLDDGLIGPLRVPSEHIRKGASVWDWIRKHVKNTLQENGFPTYKVIVNINSIRDERFGHWRAWSVEDDVSVRQGSEGFNSMQFCAVELTTPAEWDMPETYDVLQCALNLLKSRYRILVNPSCGLHIHVGRGAEWMPLEYIQRLASMLWASDKLLACLNPPWRRFNFYCPSIREKSLLAYPRPDPVNEDKKEKEGEEDEKKEENEKDEKDIDLKPASSQSDSDGWSSQDSDRWESKRSNYIAGSIRHGERSTMWRETHVDLKTIAAFEGTRVTGNFDPFIDDEAPRTYVAERRSTSGSRSRSAARAAAEEAQEERNEHLMVPVENYTFRHDSTIPPREDDNANDWKRYLGPTPPPDRVASQEEIARRISRLGPVSNSIHPRERLSPMPRLKKPDWSQADIKKFISIITKWDGMPNSISDIPYDDPGVWYGIEQILATTASTEVTNWFSCEYRPNFNLLDYCPENMSAPLSSAKRTMESREGAGSMDGPWVAAWAKIVVGVCKFAVHASPEEYLRVISNCEAFDKGEPYDVIDLLEDMGLVAESIVAAERIQECMSQWGMEFNHDNSPTTTMTSGGTSGDDSEEQDEHVKNTSELLTDILAAQDWNWGYQQGE
jgi:hypothetical protein